MFTLTGWHPYGVLAGGNTVGDGIYFIGQTAVAEGNFLQILFRDITQPTLPLLLEILHRTDPLSIVPEYLILL